MHAFSFAPRTAFSRTNIALLFCLSGVLTGIGCGSSGDSGGGGNGNAPDGSTGDTGGASSGSGGSSQNGGASQGAGGDTGAGGGATSGGASGTDGGIGMGGSGGTSGSDGGSSGGQPNTGGFQNTGGLVGTGGSVNPGCGLVGSPCCQFGVCNQASSMCSNNFCVACGGLSEPCCAGSTCTASSAACASGSCVHCGALLEPCCGGTCDSSLACVSGKCDVTCTSPLVASSGACVVPAPRPVSPLSGSSLNTRSPKLGWVLPTDVTMAHVEVCSDRACQNVLWSSDVSGESVTVGTMLPRAVAFWRLASVVGDAGTATVRTSPVWEMAIGGTHDAPSSTAWGAVPDFDGNGYADAVVQATTGVSSSAVQVFSGGATGLSSTGVTLSSGPGASPNSTFPVGDVDGDGFVDLIVGSGQFELHEGGPSGVSASVAQTIDNVPTGGMNAQTMGDVNGDGYADLIVPVAQSDINGNSFLNLIVFKGGSSGLSSIGVGIATTVLQQPPAGAADTGDFNGDGYADVAFVGHGGGGVSNTLTVFYGSANGLGSPASPVTLSMTPSAFVSCAGDANGDGYDDLIVVQNSVSVYYGGAAGLTAGSALTGAAAINQIGASVVLGLGDANGDGYSDVVVPAGTNTSNLNVYLGSASGFGSGSAVTLQPTPPASFTVQSSRVTALSALGDVNGDGYGDVGAAVEWTSTSQIKNNMTYVFSGGSVVATQPSGTLSVVLGTIR